MPWASLRSSGNNHRLVTLMERYQRHHNTTADSQASSQRHYRYTRGETLLWWVDFTDLLYRNDPLKVFLPPSSFYTDVPQVSHTWLCSKRNSSPYLRPTLFSPHARPFSMMTHPPSLPSRKLGTILDPAHSPSFSTLSMPGHLILTSCAQSLKSLLTFCLSCHCLVQVLLTPPVR